MKPSTFWLALVSSALLTGATIAQDDTSDIQADVVYGHKLGMALTFDAYAPTAEPNGAGVLFMVSGGWVSTWTDPTRSAPLFAPLRERGYTVFAVRHGSAPRFKVPEAVEDVRLATRFIRHHAERFGVDPDRLGVYGGSAGGHLSLMLGTTADEGNLRTSDPIQQSGNAVAAVVAYFPPTDLRQIVGPSDSFPALDFAPKLADSVSPLLHVSGDDAPTLLIHGTRDRLVPLDHSEQMHAALEEAEVDNELLVIEGAGHGFVGDNRRKATEAMLNWFHRHLVEPYATEPSDSEGAPSEDEVAALYESADDDSYVGVAGIDPDQADRVTDLLHRNRIPNLVEGSVVYGVAVPPEFAARARELVSRDSAAEGYWAELSDLR